MRVGFGSLDACRPDCSRWERAPVRLPGSDARVGHAEYVRVVRPLPGEAASETFARASERLLRYDVFPPGLMRATVCTPDGRVAPGATIVQCVRLGVLLRIEAAVRVRDVWNEPDEVGFRYETLAGHPEQGEETFVVRRNAEGVRIEARARSRPGALPVRIATPLARHIQRRATEAALAYFCAGDR